MALERSQYGLYAIYGFCVIPGIGRGASTSGPESGFTTEPKRRARKFFSMAPAQQRWVHLSFERALLGTMLDRFGADVPVDVIDEETLSLYAPVRVSPPFFGWVFQFGGRVNILAPDDVREQMLLMIEAARSPQKTR